MMTMLDLFALVLMYHLTKFLFQAFYPSSSPTPTIFGGPTPPPTADDIIGALAAMRRTIDGQASTIATILDEVRSRPSSSTSTTTTITTNKRLSDVEKDADEEKKRVDRLAWASANLHKRLDGQEAKTLGLATHSPKRLEDAERLVSQQQRSIGNLEKVRAVIHDRNNRLVSQVEAKREEIRGQAKVVKVQAAEITRLRLELAVEKATRAAPRGYDRTVSSKQPPLPEYISYIHVLGHLIFVGINSTFDPFIFTAIVSSLGSTNFTSIKPSSDPVISPSSSSLYLNQSMF